MIPQRCAGGAIYGTLLLFAAGCGGGPTYDGPPRAAVRGGVTFDGAPVEGGSILFVPTTEGGRKASGPILNGTYDLPEENGPEYGPHRVEILAERPTGRTVTRGTETYEETKQYIPARYNTSSELTAEVTGDSDKDVFDFDLKSK